MQINPKVIDIYHGDSVSSFQKAYDFGIRGVIHKATQGTNVTDHTYASRRRAATDAGLMWGAYHFNSGAPVADQVKHFLDVAEPDANTLMALDLEDNPGSNMTLAQARELMETLDAKLGRPCVLYSGNRIKELIAHADAETHAFFGKHKFWLCQYGPHAKLLDVNGHPLPWANYWIWQYTGDGIGMKPHAVPGIQNNMDINHYDGTDDQLKAEWAH